MIDHESAENYLESVLILKERNGKVRSIDIANFFGYSKPSVSRAVKLLTEKGLLQMVSGMELELTDKGHAQAAAVYEKHKQIRQFFTAVLGVEKATAEKDACRIEHVISEETFAKMKEYMEKPNLK